MTEQEYNAIDAMRASAIKHGARSMAHMRHYMATGGGDPTPAMRTGDMRHMALLEPARWASLTRCDASRATKEYKALAEAVGADNIISTDAAAEHDAAVRALLEHSAAAAEFAAVAEIECARVWTAPGGQACKARIDATRRAGGFIEFKTCSSLAAFVAGAARLHYHLQLGWYAYAIGQGREWPRCVVIAQEQAAPYDVAVFDVVPYKLEMWYAEALAIAERYWAGETAGAFPDRMAFELPSWADHAGNPDELDIEAFGI